MDAERPLNARLAEIREAFAASDVPAEDRRILEDHVRELEQSKIRSRVKPVGFQLSSATLVDSGGGTRELESMTGEDSLVLSWFRGHW